MNNYNSTKNIEIYNIICTLQLEGYLSKEKYEKLKIKMTYSVFQIMKSYIDSSLIDEIIAELYIFLHSHKNKVFELKYFNRSMRFLTIDILKKMKLLSRQNYLNKLNGTNKTVYTTVSIDNIDENFTVISDPYEQFDTIDRSCM